MLLLHDLELPDGASKTLRCPKGTSMRKRTEGSMAGRAKAGKTRSSKSGGFQRRKLTMRQDTSCSAFVALQA